MTDYKNTLNLPHTDFPMKAGLSEREPQFLKHWEEINLYQTLRLERANAPKFILHDGPPYANGNIHIGHAVNKTLKDIIVKAKTLSGFDAPYVPGWDCHGLPIELNVEKKHGKAGVKLSNKEFRQQCRDYANSQIDIQREDFKRLGVIGDWQNPYLTMDYKFEANIVRALAQIISNNHLQQGFKPVHWCIDCGSALAEAEVEYANKTSPAVDVRFRVIDEKDFFQKLNLEKLGNGDISIPIWTTTPWTLPANEAVAIHPDSDYILVEISKDNQTERLVLAKELAENCLQRYQVDNHKILATFSGNCLENLRLQHPFQNRQVPILLGDHVTMDTGTGAVHTAPAHGQEDYELGQKYQIKFENPVGSNGCYLANVPDLAGTHVLKANPIVIELLKAKNNLLHEEKLEHSYPHCWRHKTALIFLATPQWFISMDKQQLRQHALQAIEHVQWIPDWGQARIESMIKQRPDWCISRQRAWGVPITLLVHKQTRAIYPQMSELIEKIAGKIEQSGVEAWHELDIKELIGSEAEHYEKVTDVLDVWFDSGVTHYAVLKQNPALQWPADLYLEGSDQHRGWFQSSLLSSVAMYQQAPFKQVLTHGFTVDEKGRKMSKSLGNVIAPEKVINTLGADILRLWIAATDYRAEIAVSDEILKRTSETYRRLRNTTRFLLANLHDFDPAKDLVTVDRLVLLDQFALQRTQQLQQEIIQAYDDYEFHVIYHKLHNFCINDLGGFYLDVIKDRQYTMQKNSLARRSAQTVLYHMAEAFVRWIAPILTFTAEEIWQYLPGKRAQSVLLTQWYEFPAQEKTDTTQWNELQEIRAAVNKEIEKYRTNNAIGSSLEAEIKIFVDKNSSVFNTLKQFENELRFVFITSTAELLAAKENDMIENTISGETIWVKVTPSTHAKCGRCWHRRSDVGSDVAHPDICLRCVENLPENHGEKREFA